MSPPNSNSNTNTSSSIIIIKRNSNWIFIWVNFCCVVSQLFYKITSSLVSCIVVLHQFAASARAENHLLECRQIRKLQYSLYANCHQICTQTSSRISFTLPHCIRIAYTLKECSHLNNSGKHKPISFLFHYFSA